LRIHKRGFFVKQGVIEMDFLEQRGLPLTEENLTAWQVDLKAREDSALTKRQILRQKRAEILKEYLSLKNKEELLFRKRAAKSSQAWARPIWSSKNLYEIIIVINVVMFLLSKVFPNMTFHTALIGQRVYLYKEYYRFFTTMFMHASLSHIFFNMYALYVLGSQVESLLGKKAFAWLYLGSGMLGAAFSYLINPSIFSVGASGAIFGLLGFVLYARVFRYGSVTPNIQASLMTILGINLLIAILPGSNIDVWSHGGGLLGGFLIGMVMGPGAGYLRSDQERRNQIIIGIIGILLILTRVLRII